MTTDEPYANAAEQSRPIADDQASIGEVMDTENTETPVSKVRSWTDEERAALWRRMDALASEISRAWPKGVSAVDVVREQRRAL